MFEFVVLRLPDPFESAAKFIIADLPRISRQTVALRSGNKRGDLVERDTEFAKSRRDPELGDELFDVLDESLGCFVLGRRFATDRAAQRGE